MLDVKPIPFPPFDVWYSIKDGNGNKSWSYHFGDFWAEVEPFCWSCSNKPHVVGSVTYAFAIAANETPSNIYIDKVFWDAYEHPYGPDDETVEQKNERIGKLREWYEATATKANKKWAEYIRKNYLTDLSDETQS